MSEMEVIGLAGFAVAATIMLLVTQTKERVSWPAWLVPAAAVVPLAGLAGIAMAEAGLFGFWPLMTGSPWGLQIWLDRLASVAVAFFLLQNRARAAGMKSEVWVLAVIFTGAVGLVAMLARTVHLEGRKPAATPMRTAR
ncbi:hypothetical protein [Salinarimonas sp.]|uniref:hypothetical protein n=1 Tax=Salinarimonas sp. TaxID=2766526 RepID=UPI0032D95B10